jgi:MYXO-CTERM domain-containing protein
MVRDKTLLQFGPFVFDRAGQELRRGGFRVRMSASQVRLLSLFLQRPDALITQQEIQDCLWDDTATIDVAMGIRAAIKRLRSTLGDSATEPKYLETVVGLGYRFIASIEELDANRNPVGSDAPQIGSAEEPRGARRASGSGVVSGSGSPSRPPQPRDKDLLVADPASRPHRWSLGGSLAAAMGGLVLAGIGLAGVGAARLLPWVRHGSLATAADVNLSAPFVRATSNRVPNEVQAAALSPDGKVLVFAGNFGVATRRLDTGEETLLDLLPSFRADRIAFFQDGNAVAVSGQSLRSGQNQIWQVDLVAANTRLRVTDASLGTFAPDGSRLAYTRNDGKEIWKATGGGTSSVKIATMDDAETITFLDWSPNSRFLILGGYAASKPRRDSVNPPGPSVDPHLAAHDLTGGGGDIVYLYETVDAQTGQVLTREPNVRIDAGYIFTDAAYDEYNIPSGTLSSSVSTTPEPSNLALAATGLAGLAGVLRRRRD